jgi:hypothetical protein
MSEEKISLNNPPVPQARQQNVEVPTEIIPLPSEGRFYRVGNPLCNASSVMIRSMTAKEEDILTSRALLKSGKALPMLLQSCLTDKTINVDEMLAGDRNAALIGIRMTGYGPAYNVAITCPSCGAEAKKEIDLRELPIKHVPSNINPIAPNTNEFEFTLPTNGRRVTFKLLSGADEQEMISTAEGLRKNGLNEAVITTRLKTQILSISGETDKSVLATIIKNMTARDSRALRKYIDDMTPGVELKAPFACVVCGENSEGVEVPLGPEFFWPSE